MKQDITISIKTKQIVDKQEDEIEFMTNGSMYFKEGDCIIEYQEQDDDGLHGANTTLNICKEKVIVTRDGDFASMLVLENGKRHLCPYNTPAGVMTLGIATHSLNNNITTKGGKVLVDYDIEFNHTTSSCNKFELTVWETK
ncbi:MAG: DUF1934 domain-containing protein [Clostridia bacterium]